MFSAQEKRKLFEKNYDPSDTALAMEIGYKVIQLIESVEWALEANNHNMLIGRDCSSELFARKSILLEKLGIK